MFRALLSISSLTFILQFKMIENINKDVKEIEKAYNPKKKFAFSSKKSQPTAAAVNDESGRPIVAAQK